jgi:alkylation response protein AidB-like acyl-CoA dehydrogenase
MKQSLSEPARPYFERISSLAPVIREHADRAEREAQMPRELADAFRQAGMLRFFLPRSMGGGEITIPDWLRLIEEVARIDASAGWNFGICSGGGLLVQPFPHIACEKIYDDPRAIIAGSLNPISNQAIAVEGGWRFSGKATYASAAAHATYLMVAAMVIRDGAPQVVNGLPAIRAGLFPIEHVKFLNTWSTAGMRATGSNDCVFDNVFVPDDFTFDWLNAKSTWPSEAYSVIPLPLQVAGGFVPIVLGAARHALDAFNELAQAKIPMATRATLRERAIAQTQYAQAEGLLGAARAYFYETYDEIWRKGTAGESFTLKDHALARLGSVTSVKLAVQAVDLVADAAGMNATHSGTPIERAWRDVHTAAQHVGLNTARFEVVGRVLFGLDPGSPLI